MNKTRFQGSAVRVVRPARAAALLVILGASCLSAPEASAQLLGSLVVNITAPAAGSTVSGAIPVEASVTVVGLLTVAGVQFYVDGVPLGAEDTSRPYSRPWSTTATGNGSHALTAVARDILGVRWTSKPVAVTVFNDPTPPSVTVDQAAGQADPTSAAPVNFTAVFSEPVSGFSGSDVTISGTAGGTQTVTVSGGPSSYTVAVSGMTSGGTVVATLAAGVATDAAGNPNTASTSTDNSVTFTPPDTTAPAVTIDQAAGQADPTSAAPVDFTAVFSEPVSGFSGSDVTISGTAGGAKTVTVSGGPSSYTVAVSGMTSGGTVVATIPAGGASDGAGNPNTASTSADNSVTFEITAPPGVTRLEDTNTAISYTGTWDRGNADREWSGGTAAVSAEASARATLSFSGTGVSWVGFRGPQTGIARVFLDGALAATVDTYAPTEELQAVVFTTSGLVAGAHTLAIEVTGTRNAGATDPLIVVDAFDVTGGDTTPPSVTRIEETDARITYTDTGTPWTQGNTDRAWSGGTAALGMASGQRATLSFSGTGVSWIGFRGPQAGIANVLLDGTQVATVDLFAPDEAVQAVVFTASDLASGSHTLAIEATGTKNPSSSDPFVVVDAFDVTSGEATPSQASFERGHVLVSLETGPVQWWLPDGTLNRTLASTVPGTGEGMAFDPSGNLYVTRWSIDSAISSGNTVEMFNRQGQSLGTFGSGYDCAPHAIVFDAAGTAYVGQAACTGAILKFPPGQATPIAFAVAPDSAGSFWIDLAADGCTIFYSSWGPGVKRFDTCTRTQLPDFNVAPLPSGAAQDLRVLPDGGVLVSSGEVIARLDASGALVRTFAVPGEPSLWAGLDLVGDGTFWAGNYESSNVYRFDLATGAVVSVFNTGTPSHTVVGVRVRR